MVGLGFVLFAFHIGKQASFRMYTPEGEPHQGQMRFAGSGGLYAVMREFSRGCSNGSVNLGSSGGTNPTCKILRFSSGVTELISRAHAEKALTDKILLIRYSRDDRAVTPPGSASTHAGRGQNRLPQTRIHRENWADFPYGRLWYNAFYHKISSFARRFQKRIINKIRRYLPYLNPLYIFVEIMKTIC